jgi:hypothetical protein
MGLASLPVLQKLSGIKPKDKDEFGKIVEEGKYGKNGRQRDIRP